jgi:hypothetical protein
MQKLNKRVKSAYSSGKLQVGTSFGVTIINVPHCIFVVNEDEQPNKLKAIITEFIGYIPVHDPASRNQGFIEVSKKAIRDLEPVETDLIMKRLNSDIRKTGFKITNITLHAGGFEPIRIIQNPNTNKCIGIKQEYLDMISASDTNYDIEGDPIGPLVNESTGLAYFSNSTTTMVVETFTFSTDKEKEILETFKFTNLYEK